MIASFYAQKSRQSNTNLLNPSCSQSCVPSGELYPMIVLWVLVDSNKSGTWKTVTHGSVLTTKKHTIFWYAFKTFTRKWCIYVIYIFHEYQNTLKNLICQFVLHKVDIILTSKPHHIRFWNPCSFCSMPCYKTPNVDHRVPLVARLIETSPLPRGHSRSFPWSFSLAKSAPLRDPKWLGNA